MTQRVFTRCLEIVDALLGRESVRTIVEVGARDCAETLAFEAAFPAAKVVAFECNPAMLPTCRAAVRGHERITLVERAASDRAGIVTFYPTDPERTVTQQADGNPGASSLFRARADYPLETYVQNETTVEATTLQAYCEGAGIDAIDLLWMDIQGAELMALRGLGERLRRVRLLHLEVEFLPIYEGQPLFPEVDAFLRGHGFRLLGFTSYSRYSGDAVYVPAANVGVLAATSIAWRYRYLLRNRLNLARHRLKRALGGS